MQHPSSKISNITGLINFLESASGDRVHISDFEDTATQLRVRVQGALPRQDSEKEISRYLGGAGVRVRAVRGELSSDILISKMDFPKSVDALPYLASLHKKHGLDWKYDSVLSPEQGLLMGLNDFGNQYLNSSSFKHMSVLGSSGYGKTQFLKFLIAQVSALDAGSTSYIVDPKGGEYSFLDGFPGIGAIVSDLHGWSSLFSYLVVELSYREGLYRRAYENAPRSLEEYNSWRARDNRKDIPFLSRIRVWIDESSQVLSLDMTENLGFRFLKYLMGRGRSYGIQVVLSSQRAVDIPGSLLSQCDTSVLFHMNSSNDWAHIQSSLKNVEQRSSPPPVVGRAVFSNGGFSEDIQTPFASNEILSGFIAAKRQKELQGQTQYSESAERLSGLASFTFLKELGKQLYAAAAKIIEGERLSKIHDAIKSEERLKPSLLIPSNLTIVPVEDLVASSVAKSDHQHDQSVLLMSENGSLPNSVKKAFGRTSSLTFRVDPEWSKIYPFDAADVDFLQFAQKIFLENRSLVRSQLDASASDSPVTLLPYPLFFREALTVENYEQTSPESLANISSTIELDLLQISILSDLDTFPSARTSLRSYLEALSEKKATVRTERLQVPAEESLRHVSTEHHLESIIPLDNQSADQSTGESKQAVLFNQIETLRNKPSSDLAKTLFRRKSRGIALIPSKPAASPIVTSLSEDLSSLLATSIERPATRSLDSLVLTRTALDKAKSFLISAKGFLDHSSRVDSKSRNNEPTLPLASSSSFRKRPLLIVTGSEGVGKETLVKSIASEAGADLINVRSSRLFGPSLVIKEFLAGNAIHDTVSIPGSPNVISGTESGSRSDSVHSVLGSCSISVYDDYELLSKDSATGNITGVAALILNKSIDDQRMSELKDMTVVHISINESDYRDVEMAESLIQSIWEEAQRNSEANCSTNASLSADSCLNRGEAIVNDALDGVHSNKPEEEFFCADYDGLASAEKAPFSRENFISSRVPVKPSYVRAVAEALIPYKQRGESISPELISSVISGLTEDASFDVSKLRGVEVISPSRGIEDISLGHDARKSLYTLIQNVKGLRSTRGYAFLRKLRLKPQSVSLFHGAPGTGKTLAAEVVAKETGRPLWKVKLGDMQSAMFGGTEELLSTLFRVAEIKGAVLLLDECDTLLRDRSSLNSDIERKIVNHLLVLIEDFQGSLILTTNHANVLDRALARRCEPSIEFSLPGEKEQASILQSLLQPDAPLEEGFSFDNCVRGLRLSGGYIRNAVEKAFLGMIQSGHKVITEQMMKDALNEVSREMAQGERKESVIGLGIA
jgi:SpoVK/Ycf46/Vps4 family AAA+-type ATPase